MCLDTYLPRFLLDFLLEDDGTGEVFFDFFFIGEVLGDLVVFVLPVFLVLVPSPSQPWWLVMGVVAPVNATRGVGGGGGCEEKEEFQLGYW